MRRAAICALVSLLGWGFTSIGAPPKAHAGGNGDGLTVQVIGGPLSNITSSPLPLSPSFAPPITDYVWRCHAGINTIQLTLSAILGGNITAGGRSGASVSLAESLFENQAVVIRAPDPSGSATPIQYWVRCLPHDFPPLSVSDRRNPPPGWYLTGNITAFDGIGYYAMVLDTYGTPVWYRKPAGLQAIDVTPLSNGTIAWWTNAGSNTGFEDYNLGTGMTKWVRTAGKETDPHELEEVSNGDSMILSNPLKEGIDLTSFGLGSSEAIIDCVIQELSSDGQLVWEWHASDHIPVGESRLALPTRVGNQIAYDIYHCNSVDSDPASSNVLLSVRHADAVYLIDKSTQMVAWKMGGTAASSDGAQTIVVTGDPEGAFHLQHDARFAPNGDVTLFDNQVAGHPARGVEYHVDTNAGTATLVWSYQSPDGKNSGATGSFRRLSGGDNLIAWGVKPNTLFTEVDDSGNIMLNVAFPCCQFAYRAVKVPPSALDHNLLRATAGLAAFSFTGDTDPAVTGSGVTLSTIEGASFTGAVASLSDPDSNAQADEYLATIAWGDGSSSAGTITGPGGGPFTVSGTHTYAEEGANVATVYITEGSDPTISATVTSTVNVDDAHISSSCATPANSLTSFSGTAATFTDADPSAAATHYTATINWGDGSSAPGLVSGPDGGPFAVSASHTYGSTGKFSITTTVKDVGGSSASASCNALIYAFPSGAVAFAMGEKNTTNGSTITYRVVPLSHLDSWGGEEPSSWTQLWQKLAPACGIGWGTVTGKGGPTVRRSLPDYMGVIIISRVVESASKTTGITGHIVVVRTNSRHPGRGTVEAQVC